MIHLHLETGISLASHSRFTRLRWIRAWVYLTLCQMRVVDGSVLFGLVYGFYVFESYYGLQSAGFS